MKLLWFVAVMMLVAPGLSLAATQNKHAVAVIIGNKTYQHNDVPEVSFAHRDADAIKRYVIDILGFRERNVIDLRDATQAQMGAAFGSERSHKGGIWRMNREGKSDVVVFYSGHGMPGLSDGKGYLLPSDVAPTDVEIGGYPLEVLYANLKRLKARSVLVLLDACFSGTSHAGSLLPAGSIAVVKRGTTPPPKGFTVLTAAGSDQIASWDLKAEHGLFTEHFLRAVYGAADDRQDGGNGDGRVTLAEVKTHLDEEMTYIAKRIFGREQVATVTGSTTRVLATFPPGRPPLRSGQVEQMNAVYVAVGNADVRAKPSSRAPRTTTLSSGSEVMVTGKVKGADWYRVARGGQALGFVYGPLIQDVEQVREEERQRMEAEAVRQAQIKKAREAEHKRVAAEKARLEREEKRKHLAAVRARVEKRKRAKAEERMGQAEQVAMIGRMSRQAAQPPVGGITLQWKGYANLSQKSQEETGPQYIQSQSQSNVCVNDVEISFITQQNKMSGKIDIVGGSYDLKGVYGKGKFELTGVRTEKNDPEIHIAGQIGMVTISGSMIVKYGLFQEYSCEGTLVAAATTHPSMKAWVSKKMNGSGLDTNNYSCRTFANFANIKASLYPSMFFLGLPTLAAKARNIRRQFLYNACVYEKTGAR